MDADLWCPEPRAVRRGFARAATAFDQCDFLHRRIRDQLLAQLDLVRLEPELIMDLGAGTCRGAAGLSRRYPKAKVLALDLVPDMLRQRPPGVDLATAGDGAQLPLPDHSVDLVFCSLMLHACPDPRLVLDEVCRVVSEPGLFAFAALGPGTLGELAAAWSVLDDRPHVGRFIEIHELGDALTRAGFHEPVLAREKLDVTYSHLEDLVRDLRGTGETNKARGRSRGLMGRGRLASLQDLWQQMSDREGRVHLTVEVITGQAWAGGRPRSDPREISLEDLRRSLVSITRR